MFDDQLAPSPPSTPSAPHRALYLRWRPRRFEDVVGQEHVTRTLRNAVRGGRPAHAYLFTGPRGTGKTTVARILYRAANCLNAVDGDPCNACPLCLAALDGRALDLIEIDAASNRGIDDIRDLRDRVSYSPGDGRFKVYIIDEAHELTPQAWDAFLKTLEEPPPHALFVLATTEAHKVPATIVSRCQRFDFRRIPFDETRGQLERVALAEGMEVEPAVLERLALVARGGLRDALSLLDQLSAFAGGRVDMTVARAALSLPSIEAVRGVLDGLTRRDPAQVMALVSDVAEGGADLRLFVEELVVHLRALLLLRSGADARLTDELPADEVEWLRERAPYWSVGTLIRLLQEFSNALARTRDAQQFQVQTEVALLEACDVAAAAPAPQAPASHTPVTPRIAEAGPPELDMDGPEADPFGDAATAGEPAPPSDPTEEPDPESPVPSASEPPAAPESEAPIVRSAADSPAAAVRLPLETIRARWPDVVLEVRGRNSMLGSAIGSAQPAHLDEDVLEVAFATEFNHKRATSTTNRRIIEAAVERALGYPYRLRCTIGAPTDGQQSLLDDPVINYAARTFGGQPRRVAGEAPPL